MQPNVEKKYFSKNNLVYENLLHQAVKKKYKKIDNKLRQIRTFLSLGLKTQ